jgi:hypothetical protein
MRDSVTYYVKRGRRYIPVSEYDGDLMSALPEGSHLVTVAPGSRSTVASVNPANKEVLAVVEKHRNELCRVLLAASEMRPMLPLSPKQRDAWAALQKALGSRVATLSVDSANDIVNAFINAIQKEIE